MMNEEELIELLEDEWDAGTDTGFFEHFRGGNFESESFERVLGLINKINFGDHLLIDRRIVGLIWFMPNLMRINLWRFEEKEHCKILSAIEELEGTLMRLFGGP